jgi:hypothetical protein
MKTILIVVTGLVLAAALVGCGAPGSYTQQHSFLGTTLGAGAGAIIGGATGHPAEGALAGALIGGMTGTAVGQSLDEQRASMRGMPRGGVYQGDMYQGATPTSSHSLSRDDVVAMTRAGISDDVIIGQVRAGGGIAPLSTQDIISLKNAGVSDGLLRALIDEAARSRFASAPQPPPATYYQAPSPYYQAPSTYYQPPVTYYQVNPPYYWPGYLSFRFESPRSHRGGDGGHRDHRRGW